jgi:peroxiredoxin
MRGMILLLVILVFCFSLHAQEKPEGLYINSRAPDIRATDQYGKELRLKEILKDSLVLLVFYRGYWDPYSIKNLSKLQDSLPAFQKKRVKLIAVTPEKPENIYKTIEKTKAVFSIVHDKELKLMKAYAVVYEVDERTLARYRNADIDLLTVNGQKEKAWLPVPAIYIIGVEGAIFYRYFEPDYKKWPTVEEVLEQIR